MLIPLNFTEIPKNTPFTKICNECVLPRQKQAVSGESEPQTVLSLELGGTQRHPREVPTPR